MVFSLPTSCCGHASNTPEEHLQFLLDCREADLWQYLPWCLFQGLWNGLCRERGGLQWKQPLCALICLHFKFKFHIQESDGPLWYKNLQSIEAFVRFALVQVSNEICTGNSWYVNTQAVLHFTLGLYSYIVPAFVHINTILDVLCAFQLEYKM